MALAFMYRLELEDGTPADPPTYRCAVPTVRPGDVIPVPGRSLSVVAVMGLSRHPNGVFESDGQF